jgi:hypothetical protein
MSRIDAEALIIRMSRNGKTAQDIADMTGLAYFAVRRVQLGGDLVVKEQVKPVPIKVSKKTSKAAWERLRERNKPKPPTGRCLAWMVVEGKAVQCGAPCKGQRCQEHKHTTLPLSNSLGRKSIA